MKPYTKSTTNQEELFRIIESLEILEKKYTVRTTETGNNNEWIRSWEIDEMEDKP